MIDFNLIKADCIMGFSTKKIELDLCTMIVDCYRDNQKSTIEVFGKSNVIYAHSLLIDIKLEFYGK